MAWRILDAQFFGVAQRRERVFLVGSLGTMRCAEVLFEREGMPWDHSPSRDKRKALAGEPSERVGNADPSVGERLTAGLGFHQQDGRCRISETPDISGTITAHAGTGGNNVPMLMCRADTQANAATGENLAPTLMAHASHDAPYIYRKAQTLQICSGKDGGGKGALVQDDLSATLGTHTSQTLFTMADGSMTVRRLTPMECERLQGFPDGWTDIPYKGKPHPSDTVRYKALGNSMAVPVMRRIGERIIIFEDRGK